MKTTSDPLLKAVEDIRTYAQRAGLVIFHGLLYESAAEILWINEQGGGWNEFIDAAKAVGVRVLYLNWTAFEDFQVDEALEEVRAESDSSESERVEIEDKIEKYRDKLGLISFIGIAFILDRVQHTFHFCPEWFVAFEELRPEGDEEEEEPVKEEPDKALVNKWATILANHPQFGGSKTYRQREYLLENIAKEEYDTLPASGILDRAESIYLVDVRPKEEVQLRSEARRLRDQGLSINGIALKLGISRDRASGLVAG